MKSEFDPDKIEKAEPNKAKLFELSVNYVLNDAEILWQSSHLFLLGNSILAGFIGTRIIGGIMRNWETFILSSLGFLISVLWLLSYIRLSNYYKFRIDQAKQREPEGWMLFNGDAQEKEKQKEVFFEGYETFRKFDHSEFYLTEALRTLRMIRHAAWIGQRYSEPIFTKAFPYYEERRYWEGFMQSIREQISLMQEIV